MLSFLNRYATPLITGLFLVSLISGVALFFHFGSSYFHSMHEWLSMVLIVPFVLHIWKNWRPMLCYFKRPAFAVSMVASLIAALVFVYPVATGGGEGAGPGGRPAAFALVQKVMGASVGEMAAVLDVPEATLTAKLEAAGYTVASGDVSLTSLAAASGKSEMEIAAVLVAAK
ncbi:DUF4405 domain-containing protein [Thioclava sp. A2]|uniref:DUF4405 domain-containing protein n=1 Tax=Thioclava sp. FCG-A2 TaxID=3080562 RepID=UPI00295353E4|nr:DUF4405 domain-containing protein [Thioclava sp. A2]MDV7269921.1 DUF4405 domain-containing protein [Thioclava sp. A2]